MAKANTVFVVEQTYPEFESWRPAVAKSWKTAEQYIREIVAYLGFEHVYMDQVGWDKKYPEYVFKIYSQAPDNTTRPVLEFSVREVRMI